MRRFESSNSYRKQHGAVLVVSLLLLLVMTVLALASSQAGRMQERIAGSVRNQQLAFQSAEAGLRAGERLVDSLTAAPAPCSSAPCEVYELGALTTDLGLTYADQAFADQDWWDGHAQVYSGTALIGGDQLAHQDPQFFVEELEEVTDSLTIPPTGPPPSRMYYRITSRAEGGNSAAQAVLQSTFAKRFH